MSESSAVPSGKPLLNDRKYNLLKKSATIVLPALIALYIGLAQIWHFPKVEEVSGSLALLNTIFGGVIQASKKSYYANNAQYVGQINIHDPADGEKQVFSFELDEDPEKFKTKDEVTFRVNTDTGGTPVIKPGVEYDR
jgi:Putative phage holin Dp-1